MQGEWWFGIFQQKEVPSNGHCPVGVWIKSEPHDAVVTVGGTAVSTGGGRNLSQRNTQFLNARNLLESAGYPGSWQRGTRKRGNRKQKSMEQCPWGKAALCDYRACSKDQQKTGSSPSTSSSKKLRDMVGMYAWPWGPWKNPGGTSLRSCDLLLPDTPSLPNIRYLRNSLERILHLWMNHKPRDLSPAPPLTLLLLVTLQ